MLLEKFTTCMKNDEVFMVRLAVLLDLKMCYTVPLFNTYINLKTTICYSAFPLMAQPVMVTSSVSLKEQGLTMLTNVVHRFQSWTSVWPDVDGLETLIRLGYRFYVIEPRIRLGLIDV
ncbi:hypothetical protein AVEN_255100-1 [Araneus ventricosus]|uniref:Uncharacterized protein n=1 Tax=Araneus ventricosus TaxID=182803 RepID=A0A4Y2EGL4_ARAVE|nr:hypothetical protein AVEN_255100-1 [Araneus ventricosus]